MKEFHLTQGVIPVADAFSGTVATDIVNALGHDVHFIRIQGAGAVGTSVVTVLACDDTVPSNTHAIEFKYRVMTTADTWGDWTDATTAGFTTTAGANAIYDIWVPVDEMAHIGYGYVKAVFTEAADDPVLGCVLILVADLRNAEQPDSLID